LEVFGFFGVVAEVEELQHRQLLAGRAFGAGTPAAGAGAEQQFPLAFADGELATDGMVNHDVGQCVAG